MHLARLDQLVHDLLDQVDRDGKAISGIEAGLARNRRVDADGFALHVDQGPARIARVDGGISLDEIGNAEVGRLEPLETPALGADDAAGDRKRELVAQRVPDGQYPLADALVVAVAQRDRLEILRVDLEHGDIGVGIGAHDFSHELAFVMQPHRDLVRARHHVVVGEDVAVRGDDEAGAGSLLEARAAVARHVEEAAKLPRHLGSAHHLGVLRADVHDARHHCLGHSREGVAQVGKGLGFGNGRRGHRRNAPGRCLRELLCRSTGRKIEEAGEEQAERKCQRHEAAEFEPVL